MDDSLRRYWSKFANSCGGVGSLIGMDACRGNVRMAALFHSINTKLG